MPIAGETHPGEVVFGNLARLGRTSPSASSPAAWHLTDSVNIAEGNATYIVAGQSPALRNLSMPYVPFVRWDTFAMRGGVLAARGAAEDDEFLLLAPTEDYKPNEPPCF